MDGWPVWLASASLRDRNGRIRPTGTWSLDERGRMSDTLDVLLGKLGDPGRQREFRMNITLCRHRALSDDEHDLLPAGWHLTPARDLAGGPIEVLWSEGLPDSPSTRPCEKPGREACIPSRPDLWLPSDCGRCPPCVARAAIEARPGTPSGGLGAAPRPLEGIGLPTECERCGSTDEVEWRRAGLGLPAVELCGECALWSFEED